MAYKCPRCGAPVQRGFSRTAHMSGGLVFSMFYAAFGAFECKKCGKIVRNEFPEEIRKKIIRMNMLLVLGAIAVAIGGICLFYYR